MNSRSKVITGPNTRWSYVNAWEPKSVNGGKPCYSITLIISKYDITTLNKIREAIKFTYEEELNKLKGRDENPPKLEDIKNPLRDGDKERPFDPAYKDSFFLNATSKFAPSILDKDFNPITEHKEVYSGVYGKASISFYAFCQYKENKDGVEECKRGIACNLNNLMKIRDGESLGHSASGIKAAIKDFSEEYLWVIEELWVKIRF